MTQEQFTVVNVDSDRLERRAQLLREAGYRVIQASTNEQACSVAERAGSALLFLREQDAEAFRVLADHAPALLWMNGPEGCEFVNRAYVTFLGVTAADVRGFNWMEFVHPDDRSRYLSGYLDAATKRGLFEATFRFRRHDGEYRWMKSVGTPRFAADGTFLGYVGSTIDVTDLQAPPFNSLSIPNPDSNRRGEPHHRFKTASTVLASMTVGIAGLVLMGWIFGFTPLTSLSSQFVPMKATTAVALVCLAGSVLLLNTQGGMSQSDLVKTPGIASVLLASLAALLGVGTLIGYAGCLHGGAFHPAWMAPSTAVCLLLLSVARLVVHRQERVSERVSEYATLLVLCFAGVALIGHLYDKDSLYAVGPYSSMALHTALSFVFLATALLCARPNRGLMATLSSVEPGADMMRRMLPMTVGMLVISGGIRLVGEHKGWFDPHFGLTLLVGLNVVGFSVILWSVARSLNRTALTLSESEERLRAFLEHSATIAWLKDEDGRHVFLSSNYESRFGIRLVDCKHKTDFELWPRDVAEEFQRNDRAVLASGKPTEVVESAPNPDGSTSWWLNNKFTFRDSQGRRYVGGLGVDITARKQAEEQLRDNEQRLRFALMAGHLGSWQWNVKTGDCIWNREHFEFLGLPPDPEGRAHLDMFIHAVHPDDRLIVHQELERARRERTPYKPDFRVIRADNGEVHWIAGRGEYIFNEEGEAVYSYGVMSDITERKQAEERRALLLQVSRLILEMEEGGAILTKAVYETVAPHLNADICFNYRLAPDGQSLDLLAGIGIPEPFRSSVRQLEIGQAFCGTVAATGAPIAADASRILHDSKGTVVRGLGVTAYACHPLLSHEGRILGTLSFGSTRRESFTAAEVEFLQTICHFVAIAWERHAAIVGLREGEARLRLAHHAAGVGAFDWDMRTGVNTWTTELEAIYGLVPGEFGKTQRDWEERLHPDDRAMAMQGVEEAFETGMTTMREFRIVRPDGTMRWVAGLWQVFKDESGLPLRLTGINLDITRRKQAEEQLRKSEERLRVLTTAMPQLVWACSSTGECTYQGPQWEAVTGQASMDSLKYGWTEMIHPEDRARAADEWRIVVAQGTGYQTEYRLHMRDGTYRWYLARAEALRDASGHLTQWIGTSTDIDEAKQTEAALREAQQRLQRWNVELEQAVNEKTVELQQSQERLRAMASELNLAEQRERKRLATELHDHLQQMLVFGKITIGQGKRHVADVPAAAEALKQVDSVLSDALTYSRTLVAELSPSVLHEHGLGAGLRWLGDYMNKHGLTVTVMIPDGNESKLPEDQRVLLFQSVRELLINASKHAGTGAATITMKETDSTLSITVRDQGRGFDLAAAAAAAAAAAGIPGGGISSKFGLFSIQERMRALGGSFDIQSAPGKGTCATLVLPVTATRSAERSVRSSGVAGPESADTTPRTPDMTPPTKGKTIVQVLLVDDHAMVRQGLRSVLDAYEDLQVVGEAQNGAEAVQLVEQLRPRVVVMDINMPTMNGIEATTQIKTHWPQTIVIGISVNTEDDNSRAMRRAGADALQTKEAAVEQLYDVIRDAMRPRADGRPNAG